MASPHRIPFRTFLWEYLGHPDEETPERRRILYAIVVLRCGFALLFLLRGWSAVFATSPDAFATRLGDPARLGLGGAAVDTILFILGCTELGIGALLFFGAFTRVSAVTGLVLALLSLFLGQRRLFPPNIEQWMWQIYDWFPDTLAAINIGALISLICGLILVIICGAPFLSADRALDKLEEEERDRAPARLPQFAAAIPIVLRLGLALPIWWYALWSYAQGPGNSVVLLILRLLIGIPLLIGIWTRILAIPFVLTLALAVVDGGRAWSAMEWLLPAVPTVAIALLITGPGSLRVGQWPFRNGVAAAEAREAAGK